MAMVLVLAGCKAGADATETEQSCREAFADLHMICDGSDAKEAQRYTRAIFDEDNADGFAKCGDPRWHTKLPKSCLESEVGKKLRARLDSYWLQRQHAEPTVDTKTRVHPKTDTPKPDEAK